MKFSCDLIRKCFGPHARIRGCWPFGYTVIMPSGSSVEIAHNGKLTNFKGSEIYPLAMCFAAAVGDGTVTVSGNAQHVMLSALHGQAVGIEVNAEVKRSWFRPPTPPVPRVSGAYGSGRLASNDDLRASGLTGGTWGHGLTIGEDTAGNILRYAGPNGICLIAPPGGGKNTTCATRMLAEGENTAFVIVDPKGELLAINRRRRSSIGPTRHIAPVKDGLPEELHHFVDSSDSYNPLYGLNPKSDSYVAENDSIAQMVIAPDDSQQGKDSGFFDEGAQAGASGLDQYLIEFEPDKATLPRMAEIASTNEIFDVAAFVMQYGSTAMKARLAIFGDEHARKMQGGINDILRTLRKGIRFLTDPAIARIFQTPKEPWDFGDLKHGARPGTVFISIPAKFTNITRPVFRVLSGCAVSRLQSTPPGEWRVACLIDEFPMLGRVPVFLTAFAEGRGHGISMIPIAQEPSQIVTAYGKEGLRTILAGCEIQLYYAPRTYEAAQEISAIAGRTSVLTGSYSQSGRRGEQGSISIGETGKDVLTASQILGLRLDEMIVCAPGLLNNVLTIAKRRGYWTYPEVRPLVDPNPYWKGDKQTTKTAPVVPAAAAQANERRMVERLARAAQGADLR